MNPSHIAIRAALTTAGVPQEGVAFIYPLHRIHRSHPGRHGHCGAWTTGITIPAGTPAPDPATMAAALHRPAEAIELDAVGSCLFLTIRDAA